MNVRDETRLRDMLDTAHKARAFIAGKNRDDLERDNGLIGFAVVRALEIIGEAASKISMETRAAIPALPWKNIIGMRNRVIHDYNRVDYDLVWDVVTLQLSELIAVLATFLPPETDASEPE
jgi:uncharacterized protein with HEPN domain